MNVHWTEAALADLRAIEIYIARRSRQYARSTVARILLQTEKLAYLPHIGPLVPGYEHQELRELFEGSYRIIYRTLERQVDVAAVVHAARRLPRGLGG
jgi:plasmid stabilization system protein ParE